MKTKSLMIVGAVFIVAGVIGAIFAGPYMDTHPVEVLDTPWAIFVRPWDVPVLGLLALFFDSLGIPLVLVGVILFLIGWLKRGS